jgi:hypothetical protein
METVQIDIFTFDELSESAKEKARDWWRADCDPLAWGDESRQSIEAFCDHFGVKLKNWEVSPYACPHYSTDAENRHFRGVTLSQIDRDAMPTGYCLDSTLWGTFHDHFKKTGNAKGAFDAALWEAFKSWRDDMEWQLSDECVDELLEINEYRFDESGKFWRA